jgi:hypothetical protein
MKSAASADELQRATSIAKTAPITARSIPSTTS